jgi:hypothetical protein
LAGSPPARLRAQGPRVERARSTPLPTVTYSGSTAAGCTSPHTDTTWPFAREEAERMTAALTDAQRYKVLRGNAIRMLDLDRV